MERHRQEHRQRNKQALPSILTRRRWQWWHIWGWNWGISRNEKHNFITNSPLSSSMKDMKQKQLQPKSYNHHNGSGIKAERLYDDHDVQDNRLASSRLFLRLQSLSLITCSILSVRVKSHEGMRVTTITRQTQEEDLSRSRRTNEERTSVWEQKRLEAWQWYWCLIWWTNMFRRHQRTDSNYDVQWQDKSLFLSFFLSFFSFLREQEVIIPSSST